MSVERLRVASRSSPYSIDHGAVGATCNPVIAVEVLKKEMRRWKAAHSELIAEMPTATEHEIGWRAGRGDVGQAARSCSKPIFDAHRGSNGRLSIQTDPRFYRDTPAHSSSRPSTSPRSRRT